MTTDGESVPPETWCVVEAGAFVEFMRRAANGEDPDMLMMEFLANSETETVEGDDGA